MYISERIIESLAEVEFSVLSEVSIGFDNF